MATAISPFLVHQYASLTPAEFGKSVEPKWKVAERLLSEVRGAVEQKHLTPLDGTRVISSITATLWGDACVTRKAPSSRRGFPSPSQRKDATVERMGRSRVL